MSIITPVYLYPALLCMSGLMVVPPLLAAAAPVRALFQPSIVTVLLLLATAVTAGLAYAAPAYTYERPLRRHARVIQEAGGTSAIWEVGSVEPGLDLAENAPAGFVPAEGSVPATIPWGRLTFPFVFRATTAPLGPAPASVVSFTTASLDQGVEASITVVPQVPGVTVSFVLPPDLAPARSNLPGVIRTGRWTATFVAPPADGVSWRASFARTEPSALGAVRVVARVPWGMQPPAWFPQERSVWQGGAAWVLAMPPVATAEPLR
jgi:hypothetical protein